MPDKISIEQLKSSVEDLIVIAEKMGAYCEDVGELLGLLRHSLENPAQLRILVSLIGNQPAAKGR